MKALGSTFVAALLVFSTSAYAQFDPSKVVAEPDVISRQFTTSANFSTPAFAAGRETLTSFTEANNFINALVQRHSNAKIEIVGKSQQGRPLSLLVISSPRGFNASLPTVMLMAQQHGNEPAGGEATLVLAKMLLEEKAQLLDRVNVLIMPNTNPDATELFKRETMNGIDINRDHLLLRIPESQAISAAVTKYNPQLVLDLHEFTVAGRWVSKFGAVMHSDALLQAATVGNLSPAVQSIQGRYLATARQALESKGHRVDDYHTSSASAKDLTVSMGGVNVDTGRNVGGLRNAVSLLLETRGVGIGKANYARRVESHVLAATAVMEVAAKDGQTLIQMQQEAGRATSNLACSGNISVVVKHTPERRALNFLDAKTGEARAIEVDWRSAHKLIIERERTRPCGYLIAADQTLAIQRLRDLGVQVKALAAKDVAQTWDTETYVIANEDSGSRQDARGAISDAQNAIRMLKVSTQASSVVPSVGAFYVSLNQPLAGLVLAALEPDSQNSFVANRLMSLEDNKLVRVMKSPTL
jgi:predicted deacylase